MRPLLWRGAAWLCAIGPLAWLVWIGTQDGLGANPVEFIEHYTGNWTLRLLLLTLALSPLSALLKRAEPVQIRRTLGLWTFAYACLHFSIYLVFDLSFSAAQLAEDLIERTYITLGFSAWLLLIPLAITSTRRWQQGLKRRWKALHRAVYLAALCGALHYLWLVKSDLREPLIYLGVLLALLAARLPWRAVTGRC